MRDCPRYAEHISAVPGPAREAATWVLRDAAAEALKTAHLANLRWAAGFPDKYWLALADATLLAAVPAAPDSGPPDDELLEVARNMLASFCHPGHPGEACLQSSWIQVGIVRRWRETIERAAVLPGAPLAAPREPSSGDQRETETARADREQRIRIVYQDIVYAVCNVLDREPYRSARDVVRLVAVRERVIEALESALRAVPSVPPSEGRDTCPECGGSGKVGR